MLPGALAEMRVPIPTAEQAAEVEDCEPDAEVDIPSEQAIDVSEVATADQLQILLMRELRFPRWYGRNWDAFNDAVTGLVLLPRVLTFVGWGELRRRLPRDAKMMKSILDDYCALPRHWSSQINYLE
jgi:RNAse (barnase) inhibitor barstar